MRKTKVLYARLSLSDDPEAKQMKDNIQSGAKQMGLPKDVDVQVLFKQMGEDGESHERYRLTINRFVL